MFHNLVSQTDSRSAAEVEKNVERVGRMFEGWDAIIDQASEGNFEKLIEASPDGVQAFLLKVKSVLAGPDSDANNLSFRKIFSEPPAVDCVVHKLTHQQSVILSTFAWG
jgi:hypothetical protein